LKGRGKRHGKKRKVNERKDGNGLNSPTRKTKKRTESNQ